MCQTFILTLEPQSNPCLLSLRKLQSLGHRNTQTIAHFSCKNSRERKSRREFESPLINSISKSKTHKIACHLANICFEIMFLTKKLFFMLIAKAQKKFFKKMFKILFQNTYLQDGKPSCQFLILKLNLSKEIQTLFLIFFRVSFYRENELSKI